MRSETEIKKLVLDFARHDDRVRAVLLNGSKANPNIQPDKLQDFDLLFLVDDLESFTADHSWTNIFGEQLIFQLPDTMAFGEKANDNGKTSFAYLMLFSDLVNL